MVPPIRIGSYRVERLLGIGSFATVWLGYDASLGARVAIKVLAENWSHDLRVRERFIDEARMLWRLDHDRIVRVHALGELPDGRPYLVMLWAEGGSLRDRLAAGLVSVPVSVWLLREIAAGVAVLHANGIVHRDLTPGNVLFRSRPAESESALPAEQVVIADLGLAKAVAAASGLTARAGTPGYMAPEQDDPMAVVDTRTDVFGLGRLGMTLLSTPASRSPGGEVRLRPGVCPMVADVLRTATAYRPADRYRDAAAFAVALERATAGSPRAGAPYPAGRPTAAAQGHRAAAARLALLAAAILATMAGDNKGVPGTAVDPTGRLTVALPVGWRSWGSGWAEQLDPAGIPEPAMIVSPDPERWRTGRAVPGAFIGVSRGLATDGTPAAFVAAQQHAGCTASPVRATRQAGIEWVVARYTACPDGFDRNGRVARKPVIVESAGVGPGGAGLVYVQIAPPAGSGPEFVDELLAGVRVR
jgi:tRNA A-37 threonylcarbamoyl transferase component Bud32